MPSRLVIATSSAEVAGLFGLPCSADEPALAPRYNIAPPQLLPVIRVTNGTRELAALRWGLIPHWSGDPPREAHAHARAETVSRKPSFRDAFHARRCLLFVNGFYGWKPVGPRKQPYYFQQAGGGLLVCAGIWDRWTGLDDTVETVAMLTMPANELVMPADDRMPVVLGAEQFELWLDPREKDPAKRLGPLVPFPAESMECWPVGTRVNSPAEDDPDLIARIPEPL
jgi:putative SOS response-associated peptidase YedK